MNEDKNNTTPYHVPALLAETIEGLDIHPDGVYVDVTFGGGGHSRAILERLDRSGRLYSFDQDIDAIRRAFSDDRLTLIYSNFKYLTNFMAYHDVEAVDGVLGDLGVSFHHFDDPERGFSFRWPDGPLDMRMNPKASRTAAQLLNNAPAEELTRIFKLYGELKNARQIADAIVKARQEAPLTTTADLLGVISPLMNPKREKKDLACVYQALRIVINDEIEVLRRLLTSAAKILRPGGRLVIITYHSLEDRLVKNFMKTGNLDGEVIKDFFGNVQSPFKVLTSKPIEPSEAEIEANPRSRSAKLRIAVRR